MESKALRDRMAANISQSDVNKAGWQAKVQYGIREKSRLLIEADHVLNLSNLRCSNCVLMIYGGPTRVRQGKTVVCGLDSSALRGSLVVWIAPSRPWIKVQGNLE